MKLFRKQMDQNKKLLKNIEEYEKEITKQQKSQILGQKPAKRTTNKEKDTIVHNSPRVQSVRNMV